MKSSKHAYDKTERQKIVDFIVEHNLYFELHGKSAWQRLESENVCPGRTWQSMKEHFQKVIINSLDTLNLEKNEIQRILKCFHRTYAKRESDHNDDELGRISKKSRVNNENETLSTKENVTKNQNETNMNTVEKVQNENQKNERKKEETTNQSKETFALKEKNVTEDQIESYNKRVEEIRFRSKKNEKKISNNEELNIGTSIKNVNRKETNITEDQNKNQITDVVTSSRKEISKLNVGSKSSGRIREEQENNKKEGQENNAIEEEQKNDAIEEEQQNKATEEEQNESPISEMINEEREEEPNPPIEEFSEEDDVKIIRHIQENMDWSIIKFNDTLYESCKNALINHSALSIKNRFLNVILPKLHKYEVLEISDIFLFYDRAGVKVPEEFLQIVMDSQNSENSSSQDSDKSDSVINISDSDDSINLEANEENTIENNNSASDNKNKENICISNVINLRKNKDTISGREIDLILKPPKCIFQGEFLADQLCFNINNEKHVFILESIVGDNYDSTIKELTDKYSILNTNIHKVDAVNLEKLTKIKTLNEELDRKILELARKRFKNKIIVLPGTELGVPNATELARNYFPKKTLPFPNDYSNRNKNKDKNFNLNEKSIDLNTCNDNNNTLPINISFSSHSSPIISMTQRRPLKKYENKNKEQKNDNGSEKINKETNISELLNKTNHILSESSSESDVFNLPTPKLLSPVSKKTAPSNQQEIELNNSEDVPLSQIRVKLIEEINASHISELEGNNNLDEQSKEDTEEVRHFHDARSNLLNVMKRNMLLSKKCKEIIERKNADADLE